jgi:hypothetical protein
MRIARSLTKGAEILGRFRMFDKRKVTYLITEKCTTFGSTRVEVIKWVQLLSFTTTEYSLLPPDFWPVFGNFPLHQACLSHPNGPGPGRNSDFCGPEKAFCTTFGAGK